MCIYIWEIYGGLSVSVAISCCCLLSPQAAHTLTFTSFASAYDSPESSVLQGSTGRDGLSGLRLATRSGYTWRQHATAIQRFAAQLQLQSYEDLQRLSPLTVHRSKGKRCTSTGITRVFQAFQHGSDTAQHHRCLNDLNDLANDQESLLVLSVSMTLQVESQSHGETKSRENGPNPNSTIDLEISAAWF